MTHNSCPALAPPQLFLNCVTSYSKLQGIYPRTQECVNRCQLACHKNLKWFWRRTGMTVMRSIHAPVRPEALTWPSLLLLTWRSQLLSLRELMCEWLGGRWAKDSKSTGQGTGLLRVPASPNSLSLILVLHPHISLFILSTHLSGMRSAPPNTHHICYRPWAVSTPCSLPHTRPSPTCHPARPCSLVSVGSHSWSPQPCILEPCCNLSSPSRDSVFFFRCSC